MENAAPDEMQPGASTSFTHPLRFGKRPAGRMVGALRRYGSFGPFPMLEV